MVPRSLVVLAIAGMACNGAIAEVAPSALVSGNGASDPVLPGTDASGPTAPDAAGVISSTDASDVDAPAIDPADAGDEAAPRVIRPLSPTFVYVGVNHVLSTGQSLAEGHLGTPPLSTAQPYGNLMFTSGVMAGALELEGGVAEGGLEALVPLVEGDVVPRTVDPVETMSSGLANLVASMASTELLMAQPEGQRAHDLLVSVSAAGATDYPGLAKGSPPYALGMAQVLAARDLAAGMGKTYAVRAITTVHGESDHVYGNTHYATDLATWQADYEADVRALTGQAQPVPLLETQMSSWTGLGGATSLIPGAQLDAHVSSAGKVVLVGPKYHLPYADGVHLTSEGYRHMGEDYAKVYRRVVLEEQPWEPLRPETITREATLLTVTFEVPEPPLVLDTGRVSDPGHYGFEFVDDDPSPPAITGVAIVAPKTVRITLSKLPTGPNPRLRYAYSGTPGAAAGPMSGPRGNLRDSDATPSRNGDALYNWCVHFEMAVP